MKISHLLAGAVFILGCATGAAVKELIVPARAQGQAPIVYQYTTFSFSDLGLAGGSTEEREGVLNRYGQAGWRVAATVGMLLIFERAVQLQPRPMPTSPPQPSTLPQAPALPAKP